MNRAREGDGTIGRSPFAPPAKPSPTVKKKKSADDPPYAKYAFLNPYNLSLLAGASVASAATGHWWIGVGALVAETVWMLFAPDSPALQNVWFDKVHEQERLAGITRVRDDKYRSRPEADGARGQAFLHVVARIRRLALENPSMTAGLVRAELVKRDGLYDDFLDLAIMASKGEAHLRMVNFEHLNALWRRYQDQAKAFPERDQRREVAEKNLEVLGERRRRFDDLAQTIAGARGQMDLLDNTVRLLGDEIVAMTAPGELSSRVDELRLGVATIRETTQDMDAVYAELEDAAEEPARRASR